MNPSRGRLPRAIAHGRGMRCAARPAPILLPRLRLRPRPPDLWVACREARGRAGPARDPERRRRPAQPHPGAVVPLRAMGELPRPAPTGPPSAARRVLRRVAGLLPPPRDEAAKEIWRATRDFAAGRPPASWKTRAGEPPLDPRSMARAQRAYEDGRLDRALEATEGILADHPRLLPALEIRRGAYYRAGELTASLGVLRTIRRFADTPERAKLDHQIVAMLRESDPDWLPRIPGPPETVEPARGDRVLHLLEASLPDRQSGYTMRSHYTISAQRGAGMDPVAMTVLGFPRSAGRVAPVVEVIDGSRFHRLDLGAGYPDDVAPDRFLEDFAWVASTVVREERPAILHACSGSRGHEIARVGLALRERHGLPLVYEVRGFLETTWSSRDDAATSEFGRRCDAVETRTLADVDAVVTIADAIRDDIVARGIEPEKVFVVPNGVDAQRFTPKPADPAFRARHGLHGFVFGYISNLDHPRENQELLVDAAGRLRAKGRDITCLIVGDGARRAVIEDRVRRARLGESVVFTGAVPHDVVPDFYAALDAYVVPRRDERAARHVTPLNPCEAMAMGRPLVVADLPALTEIAAPDERGLAFAPGDVGGLVACLERLMDDAALAARLAAAGRAWVVRERSWASNVPRFEDAYAFARAARAATR